MTPRAIPAPRPMGCDAPSAPARVVAVRDDACQWQCHACATLAGLAPSPGAWRLASEPPIGTTCRTCGAPL